MTHNEPDDMPVRPDANKFDRRVPAVLAAVGLACAAALQVVHIRAYAAPSASSFCSMGSTLDCTTVALSRWSIIGRVPMPIWGIAGFIALGLTAWWRSTVFLLLSGFAALASTALLMLELGSIHSVCVLCEGVHVISWALFGLAWRARHSLTRTSTMTLLHLLTVPVGIVIEAHFLLTPYWTFFSFQHGVNLPQGLDANGRHWIGAENPTLVLDEYVDYSCPHCAVAASSMRKLLAVHPKELRIVRHQDPHMRCPFIPGASHCEFVRAADCAGEQDKFWEMDSWLFQRAAGTNRLDYSEAIRVVEIDGRAFTACMSSEAAFSRADAEFVEVARAKLYGTPAYFIAGKQYNGGEAYERAKQRL